MQFTLGNTEYTIEECNDGFRWEVVNDGVCLHQGEKAFGSVFEAQQGAIRHAEVCLAEENRDISMDKIYPSKRAWLNSLGKGEC